MRDIQEPLNMYDPYTLYSCFPGSPSYEPELDEVHEEFDPEEFMDLDDLFEYIYNN